MGTLAHRGRERARGTAPIACLLPLNPQAEQYLHACPYSAGPRGPTRRTRHTPMYRNKTYKCFERLALPGRAPSPELIEVDGLRSRSDSG